ncbi:MAG: CCA tRNA nucleotidyltransferase [Alphaproteobacteria bacterium]
MRDLFGVLTADGETVRFVGGCVRDALLGRPVKDIDLATTAPPEKVMRLLKAGAIKALPTGLAHGTVTALVDHRPVEITTLRVDVETDGRHATVAFTDDWAADAGRRDFTMNALYADLDGRVFDPVGGLADARAGRVRFVGDADTRIEEDGLRSLRFFRFHAWYGKGEPDAAGLRACRRHRGMIAKLSGERIQHELLRLLAAPDPLPALRAMRVARVLAAVLPAGTSLDRLPRLLAAEPAAGGHDPIRRLAALLPAAAEARRSVAHRLRLSNKARDRLIALAARAPAVTARTGESALRQGVDRVGQPEMIDRALLAGLPDQAARIAAIDLPDFPLDGHDAHAVGIAGPAVGAALAAVRGWWAARDFRPDRAACLAELRRRA